ncbi:amino acid adenylation domain-containing protein [Spizellomyces punctatus DAOM BR117]|uniref:Amino acid adenylation domain-containing protein n=1 Tax=Spizellomyces punctatus (strain DAOM BR117) TaxID=645134 RepID=A0A0L0HFD0_SPIPD|nr:amino acid adenylation domain-containing protein [Spizellomyces punctatus DAOM BR117]KNC99503.1 amino acid adenylation domain-containing protein [Spizellomyces punctatus DAOM BR117]|eukprot:XP_016607543.1 amino acid adenylation domain-containing protein [Spizellomyces punctatus DAOM BR117]
MMLGHPTPSPVAADQLITAFPNLSGKLLPSSASTASHLTETFHSSIDVSHFAQSCAKTYGPNSMHAVILVAWAQILKGYVGEQAVGFQLADLEKGPVTIPTRVELHSALNNLDLVNRARSVLEQEEADTRVSADTVLAVSLDNMNEGEWEDFCSAVQVNVPVKLLFLVNVTRTQLTFQLTWNSNLFPINQGLQLLSQFDYILQWTLANPIAHPLALDFSALPESQLSIQNPNPIERTNATIPGATLLHHLFEQTCILYPHRLAIEFLHSIETGASTRYTYQEVNEKANQLARVLLSHGVQPDDMIPIYVDRSPNMYIAFLAVLKAGAAYVPLASDAPVERIAFVAGDVAANIMITDAKNVTLCLEHNTLRDLILVNLDSEAVQLDMDGQDKSNTDCSRIQQEHLAYVMYTSGSTGKPKGVQLQHGNGIESILSHHAIIPHASPALDAGEKFLQFASPTFDVSVFEIFFPFSLGMCLCSASKELLLARLEDTINALHVTHMELTPTVAGLVTRSNVPGVKALLTIGEMLTQKVVDEWAGDGSLHNAYGPTECAIHCTMAADFDPTTKPSNIGIALDTCTLYVMGQEEPNAPSLSVVPIGHVGELYVGGKQVARGYLNRPEANAGAYFIDPRNPATRIYKTGDLVRLLPNNTLEFIGRVADDQQVKLRGQRIELGEISHVVAGAHSAVVDVVTAVINDERGAGGKMLVSFVAVGNLDCPVVGEYELIRVLRPREVEDACKSSSASHLPPYMIPNAFVFIDSVPRNLSGKTDRKRLAKLFSELDLDAIRDTPLSTLQSAEDEQVWEKNATLSTLREVVCKMSKTPLTGVTLKTSIFSLGIDSLGAIILCSKLRERNMHISVTQLLQSPTMEEIGRILDSPNDKARESLTKLKQQRLALREDFLSNISGLSASLSHLLKVPTSSIEDCYPCTPLQEGLLAETLKDPKGKRYYDRILIRVAKNVTADSLRRAWEHLTTTNPILRTGFASADGVLNKDAPWTFLQVVWEPGSCPRQGENSFSIAEVEDEAKVAGVMEDFQKRNALQFESLHVPPVTAMFVTVRSGGSSYLAIMVHHAVYDGWCVPLMLRDVEAYLSSQSSLPRPAFRNIVEHHFSTPAAEAASSVNYWKTYLADLPSLESFPTLTSKTTPPVKDIHISSRVAALTTSIIEEYCRALSITPQTLAQATWAKLLALYTGQQDVIFGSTLSGRNIPVDGIEAVMGPCIHLAPVRVIVSNDDLGMLQAIQKDGAEMLEHSAVHLRVLAENVGRGGMGGHGLFDTWVVYQKVDYGATENKRMLEVVDTDDAFEDKIMIEIDPNGDKFLIRARCKADIIPPSHVDILLEQYENILLDIIERTAPAGFFSYPIQRAVSNRASLLNASPCTIPGSAPLMHQYVERWAQETPDRPALDFLWENEEAVPKIESITYKSLNEQANRIAHHLMTFNLPLESIIPICFDKSPLMYITILAVLKAGYAYLPIEPGTPAERVQFILRDAGAKVAITVGAFKTLMVDSGVEVLCLDEIELKDRRGNPDIKLTPGTLAYVLYTSGTTGQPKGVMIEHGNVMSNLEALQRLYPPTDPTTSRMLQFATYTFDVSVFEIFYAFAGGMTLCSASKMLMLGDLESTIRTLVPTHLDLTSTAAGLIRRDHVPSVKVLIQTGEALTRRVHDEWACVDGVTLIDAYGPTETTNVCVVYCGVEQETRIGCIGEPLNSCSAMVVDFNDEKMTVLPLGCVGELCIGGPQVGRGYLNRSDLTDAKFRDIPNMGRVYRTGDVARILPSGEIQYLGRKDDQIKLNGLRIELGEINAVLVRSSGGEVRDAVTVIGRREGGRDVLVSFLALGGHQDRSVLSPNETVRDIIERAVEECRRTLPYYMVPNTVVPLTELPRGLAGKVDRKALQAIYETMDTELLGVFSSSARQDAVAANASTTEPWSPMELVIRSHISSISHVPEMDIGRTTSIFQLGLDSISAIQLSAKFKQSNLHLSMIDIMQNPTIDRMAALLDAQDGVKEHVSDERALAVIRDTIQAFDRLVRGYVTEVLEGKVEDIAAIRPCTPMQESMLGQTLRGGGYVNYHVWEISSHVDAKRLQRAWEEVVELNEVLRTGFVPVGDVEGAEWLFAQVVWKRRQLVWRNEESGEDVEETITNVLQTPFPNLLSGRPPLSLTYHNSPTNPYLILSIHHALYDGRSLRLILDQVRAHYHGDAIKDPPSFSWALERILAQSGQDVRAERMWKEVLDGFEPVAFPDVSGRGGVKEGGRTVIVRNVGVGLEVVERACREMDTTLQALGMATWSKLLSTYTGTPDTAFGVVLSGRTDATQSWNDIIGPCLNTVPCRITFSEETVTYRSLVQQVQKAYTDLLRYQHTPLRKIQKWAGVTDGRALFDTLFVFDRVEVGAGEELWRSVRGVGEVESVIAVELQARSDGTLTIEIACKSDMVSAEQAGLLAEQFESTLIDTITHPDSNMNEPNHPSHLLSICNPLAQANDVPSQITFMHSWLEYHAAHKPTDLALEFAMDITETHCQTLQWRYEELNHQANRIAHFLRTRGVGVEDMIPVCIPRSPLMYAAMMGVSKAGAAYVPVDPDAPAERKRFVIKDTRATLVLSVERQYVDLQFGDVEVMPLDVRYIQSQINAQPRWNPVIDGLSAGHLAYVLYTSGTTGRPKGVLVQHSNVVQSISSFKEIIPFTPTSRFLQFASCAFDVSIFESLVSWSVGICLCSAPKDVLLKDLELAIRSLNVSHADLTPSVAGLVRRSNVPSLEVLVTGGEALTQQVLAEWGPDQNIFNAYGPTEATIGCTMLAGVKVTDKTTNIGRPFGNVSAFVMGVGGPLSPVLKGGVGELCVGGPLVARGYLNQPQLTDQKFVEWTDPITKKNHRLYKTGDLVRMMPDGTLEFQGRADQQVKLNGIRIEVDEISHVVKSSCADVKAVVTLLLKHPEQPKKQIVSFVACASLSEGDMLVAKSQKRDEIVATILEGVKRVLPLYMVPAHILVVTHIPLGATGKTDTKALGKLFETATPSMIRSDSGYGITSKEWTRTETTLRTVLATVSNTSENDITHSTTLFELGLDSLSAILVSSRLRSHGVDLSVSDMLQVPSVAGMAALADRNRGTNKEVQNPLVRGQQAISEFNRVHRQEIVEQVGDVEVVGVYPCTPLQEGMIAASIATPGLYVNHFVLPLEQDVVPERLETAWLAVCRANEVLRTGFCGVRDGFAQVVYKDVGEVWSTDMCQTWDDVLERVGSYKDQLELSLLTPPIRVRYVGSPFGSQCVLSLHHALYDGWSLDLMFEDVQKAYKADTVVSRPPFSQCVEYALGVSSDDAQKFWERELEGWSGTRFPDLSGQRFLNGDVGTEYMIQETSRHSMETLEGFCKVTGTTLLALFQLAYAKLLSTYLSTTDIVFGHVISGRTLPIQDVESILGPTFNTLPCRIRLDGSNTDALSRLQKGNAAVLPYQTVGLRQVQKWVKSTSLFDTLFVYMKGREHGGDVWKEVMGDAKVDYPLSIEVESTSTSLTLRLASKTSTLSTQHAHTFLSQLDDVIHSIITTPDAPAKHLLIPPERLSIANHPPKQIAPSVLHARFEGHVERIPDAPALYWYDRVEAAPVVYTYAELDRLANQMAGWVASKTDAEVVGISLEKGVLMYIALLGVLKAGKAFVMVDRDLPIERKRFMVCECGGVVVVGSLDVDAFNGLMPLVLDSIDTLKEHARDTSTEHTRSNTVKNTNVAYVLYTSGTTGQPKGVQITHDNAVNALHAFTTSIPWKPTSRFLQFATCSFDDVLLAHLEGALTGMQITHVDLTPSVAALVRRDRVPTIEVLVTGGEALTARVVDEWSGEDVVLVNAYGPTEATIGCVMTRVDKRTKPECIGRVLETCSGFVVGADGRVLPLGGVGELVIGGPQVGKGYLDRPELTFERFVMLHDYGRTYKTGDVVRMLADGSIEFLGRADDQVKLNGIRIELGEISSCLGRVRGVLDVSTLVCRHPSQVRDQVVSFLCVGGTSGLEPLDDEMQHLVDQAVESLPMYMRPRHVFSIGKMPLASTGKTDRKALEALYKALDIHSVVPKQTDMRPLTDLETAIRQVLASTANVPPDSITRTTTLAQLGLDSISAIRMCSALQTRGINVPVSKLMRYPSIGMLVPMLQEEPVDTISGDFRTQLQAFEHRVIQSVSSVVDIPSNELQAYPCTPLQEGMLAQTHQDPRQYITHTVLQLNSGTNVERLKMAWEGVIRGMDILRSSFQVVDGVWGMAQVVRSSVWMPWSVVHVDSKEGIEAFMEGVEMSLGDPPIAFGEVHVGEDVYLVLSMHHALYDGWSFEMILRDVEGVYRGGLVPTRPAYRGVVEYILSRPEAPAKKYWMERLKGVVPTLVPDLGGVEGIGSVRVCEVMSQVVESRVKGLGVSLLAVGQAVWAKVLGIYCGEEDIVFGHLTSGRTLPIPNITSIPGPTFNTLPIRTTLSPTKTNLSLIQELDAQHREGMPYACTPLRDIQKWVGKSLFETLFVVRPKEEVQNSDGIWRVVDGKANVDYALSLELESTSTHLRLHATTTRLALPQLDLLLHIYEVILTDMLTRPEAPSTSLPTLPPQTLSKTHGKPIKGFESMSSGVERFARTRPTYPALEFMTGQKTTVWTYSELNGQANRFARRLRASGVRHGDLVPIIVVKSVWMYVALLGVLKCGAGYVPIDPEAPMERKRFVVGDVDAKRVVVSRGLELPGIDCIIVENSEGDADGEFETEEVDPTDTCYVIYTSGTTGTPKGVEISHANLYAALKAFESTIPITSTSRFLQFANYTFDVSVFETFLAWRVGCTLVSASKDVLLSDLTGVIRSARVTHMDLTPTVAALVRRADVPDVEVLVTGGELLTQRVLDEWVGVLYNAYGPTEATIGCSIHKVLRGDRPSCIGKVFDGCDAMVVSGEHVVPRGAIGELWVGGPQLPRGTLTVRN